MKTMQILIRWLHQKPGDLDLHSSNDDISWFSRTRVNINGKSSSNFIVVGWLFFHFYSFFNEHSF